MHNADDVMAAIVAKRLVEYLERAGFVVMKRPPALGGAAIGRVTVTRPYLPALRSVTVTRPYLPIPAFPRWFAHHPRRPHRRPGLPHHVT